MGAKYISTLPDAGAGQGIYVPGFQAIGEDLLKVTRSSSYNWFVVVDDAQRPAFEASAVAAAQREDPTGALAAQVAALGIKQALPKGANRTSSSSSSGGGGVPGAPAGFQRASAAPFYVVRWTSVPRNDPGLLAGRLQDLYRDPLRRPTLDRVLTRSVTAVTPILPGLTLDLAASGSTPPSSVVFAPAWVHTADAGYGVTTGLNNGTNTSNSSAGAGRAICATGFHWTTVLEDTMPRSIASAVVVLHSPPAGGGGAVAGPVHTFIWDNGVLADGGDGDGVTAGGVGLVPGRLRSRVRSFDVPLANDTWRVELYPTRELEAQYVTERPRNTALAVIAASLACVILFGCAPGKSHRRVIDAFDVCVCAQGVRVLGASRGAADEQAAARQPGAAAAGALAA
jgi:hypothetical protein